MALRGRQRRCDQKRCFHWQKSLLHFCHLCVPSARSTHCDGYRQVELVLDRNGHRSPVLARVGDCLSQLIPTLSSSTGNPLTNRKQDQTDPLLRQSRVRLGDAFDTVDEELGRDSNNDSHSDHQDLQSVLALASALETHNRNDDIHLRHLLLFLLLLLVLFRGG